MVSFTIKDQILEEAQGYGPVYKAYIHRVAHMMEGALMNSHPAKYFTGTIEPELAMEHIDMLAEYYWVDVRPNGRDEFLIVPVWIRHGAKKEYTWGQKK